MRIFLATVLVAFVGLQALAAYEIGEDLLDEAFWRSDPVLFVRKHVDEGFQFTSDAREGADSRLDGAVTCFGIPVFETRVAFADEGGIGRLELVLFNTGGTETMREFEGEDGKKFRQRTRVEKTITREAFFKALADVRDRLNAGKAKSPKAVSERLKNQSSIQKSQAWPKSAIGTCSKLTWNYSQDGRSEETFKAGFIRLTVDGPTRAAEKNSRGAKAATAGVAKIADNVIRDPRGDVFIDNLPMVDQGQKGYCSVATAERVLRYYGVEVDEHEIAQAAGTSAENGTSTLKMKKSVEAIGKKYRLATVVCYGDFEKGNAERIAGIVDEVRVYNKAAKKLKKPEIADDVYITHKDNTTWYSSAAVDKAMDPEVRKEMRVHGGQKAKFVKFQKDVRDQIAKGVPLFWGVTLGIYPEPGLPQAGGAHMRLVIGYNDKKKELLYSDSWGAGHELKRMPMEWAWTISHCLLYMKPLTK